MGATVRLIILGKLRLMSLRRLCHVDVKLEVLDVKGIRFILNGSDYLYVGPTMESITVLHVISTISCVFMNQHKGQQVFKLLDQKSLIVGPN